MRKLIDLPENKVKDLKRGAINHNLSFKKYLEFVILKTLDNEIHSKNGCDANS